jgi:hypothetical protein
VQKIRWLNTVPIFILGLSILAVFLLLPLTGNNDILLTISSILTPLMAFVLGATGLWMFGRVTEMREDQIHSLYLWVSIGLLLLALSEITGTLVSFSQSPLKIEVTVGLVQMPGLLLWGFGILQYLRSLNSALEFSDSGKLWIILLIVALVATTSLVVINLLYYPGIGLVENIVLSPLIIGLVLFTIIALGCVWVLRQGAIAKILVMVFIGFLLYLIRTIQWVFTASLLGTPSNSIFALEAFVFIGAAFILARKLGNPSQ